jgi:hypothetical protein
LLLYLRHKCDLCCLHPVVLYDEVLKEKYWFLICRTAFFFVLLILFVNIIIITINYFLVQHVLACISHFQVIPKRNVVFGFCIVLK